MDFWIARNKDGELFIHNEEPIRMICEKDYVFAGGNALYVDKKLYPQVTFENSPQRVQLIIQKERKQLTLF